MLSQSLFDGFYEGGRGQQRGVALPGHYDTEIVGQAFLGIDDVAGVEPYLFIEIAAGLHGVDDGMAVLDDGPVVPVERYETYLDIIEERASYVALVRVYHHRARALLPGQRKASIGVVLADVGIADAFVYNIQRKRYGFFQEFEVDSLIHPLLEGQTVAREDMEEFVGDEVVEVFHFTEIRAKVDAVAPRIAKRVALLVHCGLNKHDFIGQGKIIALPLGTRQNAVEATPHAILLCGGEIQALALHEREQLLPRSVRMQSAAVNVKLAPAFIEDGPEYYGRMILKLVECVYCMLDEEFPVFLWETLILKFTDTDCRKGTVIKETEFPFSSFDLSVKRATSCRYSSKVNSGFSFIF